MQQDYPETVKVSHETAIKLIEIYQLKRQAKKINNLFKPLIKYLGYVGLSFAAYSCFKLCFAECGGALVLPDDIACDKKFSVYCLNELRAGLKLCSSLLFEQQFVNRQLFFKRKELQRLFDQNFQQQ